MYDTLSKNLFTSYFENIEISIAMNMLFLEHFKNKNNSVIETFDSAIEIVAFSKNSSLLHIENLKTLKKNSIYVYELFAFFAFDFNIDIDFEIYTIDSEIIYSSTQSSFTSFISSITLQVVDCYTISNYKRKQFSTCFADYTTTNYEKKQSSTCFDDCMISNYEKKQIVCFTNNVTASNIIAKFIVTKFVVRHALLIYCLIWIRYITMSCIIMLTLYEYVTLLNLSIEYKTRSKMKIKKLSKSKHIETKNQQIVVEIFAKFTYETITFSNASLKVNTLKIFVVLTYEMILFFNELQKLKTFNFEILESTYDFDFRVCKTIIWYHAIATRIKFYFCEFSTFFDMCFTNFIVSRTQRDLFNLKIDIKIAMCMKIYAVCLKMI